MLTLEQHYALAGTLGYGQREARMQYGPVRPWWSADGRYFWYATRDARGSRHVLVNVQSREASTLFDPEALAAALTAQAGKTVAPASLVLGEVRYDAPSASTSFVASESRWRWHDSSRTLVRLGEAFGAHELASPDGTAAVSLDGPNLRLRKWGEAATRLLTTDGEPEWGYGDYHEGYAQIAARLLGMPVKPAVVWSPDGERLAVLRADQRHVPLNHLVQAVPPKGVRPVLHSYRYPTAMDAEAIALELWIIDRDGRRVRADVEGLESRCFNPLRLGHGRWSADGRHFDLLVNSRDFKRLTLWRIDTESGAAQRLLEEESAGVTLGAPGLGEPSMWRVLRDGRVLAWSQRSGWGHLYLYSQATGWQALTHGPWLVRGILSVDEAAQRILFIGCGREPGVNPYYHLLYAMGFDGSGLALLTPEQAHHEFAFGADAPLPLRDGTQSVSPDGSCFVDVWSTVTTPQRSVMRDAATGAILMDLATADPAGGWPEALPPREPFSVAALDAAALPGCADLWGMLYKPAGFDPARKYPVIEVIYGGPQIAIVGHGWSAPFYAGGFEEQLAALGFVVVIIDGPGTPGRSHAFQLAAHGRLESCGSLPDHVNAIRQLAASRPWMDLDRVGITGWSFGGYFTAMAVIRRPDVFRCGVARAPVVTWEN
jgi:dipeptidyl-peptidase-4